MNAKSEFSKMLIIISIVFLLMGLFTPLPFYIFSGAGAIGITIGWLLYISGQSKESDENIIDVDYKQVDSTKVSFDERLRKLEELKNDKLITEEEYSSKRKQMMKEKW